MLNIKKICEYVIDMSTLEDFIKETYSIDYNIPAGEESGQGTRLTVDLNDWDDDEEKMQVFLATPQTEFGRLSNQFGVFYLGPICRDLKKRGFIDKDIDTFEVSVNW